MSYAKPALGIGFAIHTATARAAAPAQSALAPASDQADAIATLWWVMLVAAALAFAAVMAVLVVGLWRARAQERPLSRVASRRLVLSAGVAVPLAVLVGLVGGSLALGEGIAARPPDNAVSVEVTGWRWWWEVRYLDAAGELIATTANEIHVPVGRPVRLVLKAHDVIHSFWVPNLHGKTDMVPGRVNTSWFTARRAGTYRGQCAEFCGTQHALMGFLVVAEPPAAFAAWLARQRQDARPPHTALLERGRDAFTHAGCAACHAIRGVSRPEAAAAGARAAAVDLPRTHGAGPAAARIERPVPAPDLTHFGSRRTLAAASRAASSGHLGGWIADPRGIKPGALMPPTLLEPADLIALISYLQSLE